MARELIAQIGCFRGKAAIEWQAMAVDRVENDPQRTRALSSFEPIACVIPGCPLPDTGPRVKALEEIGVREPIFTEGTRHWKPRCSSSHWERRNVLVGDSTALMRDGGARCGESISPHYLLRAETLTGSPARCAVDQLEI